MQGHSQSPLSGLHTHDPPQLTGAPRQNPMVQVSERVHRLPSSHARMLGMKTHPPPSESQVSSVQGLPSLQKRVIPDVHTPPEQRSPVVHALPSSHEAPLVV